MRKLALLCFACALALALTRPRRVQLSMGEPTVPPWPAPAERAAIGQCGLPSPGPLDRLRLADTERDLSRRRA